jgi:membrane-bound metal-dependent hydrolase YbcI (DUF457 family)
LLGASIVAALGRTPAERSFKPLLAGALLANAADLDFALAFAFHSRAWHRGFSHSIAFALMVCLVFVLSLGRRRVREAVTYGLAYASHGILDYLTTKEGGGVELLWPFSSERFVFDWVGLSELPSRMPAMEVVTSLALEFALFAPLLVLTIGLRKYARKNESKG